LLLNQSNKFWYSALDLNSCKVFSSDADAK